MEPPAPLKVIIRLLDLVAILYFRMALVVGVGDHKGPQATPKALSRPSTVIGFCPKTRDQDILLLESETTRDLKLLPKLFPDLRPSLGSVLKQEIKIEIYGYKSRKE